MTLATGIGSLPGEDPIEATKIVLDVFADDVPYLPELPARGATAQMIGRALAVVDGLDADLQPAGWRLTGSSGSPGMDQRRARSLLLQDLDALEEQGHGFDGPFKVQVAGPWTLASIVERPRGDRLLADHGARRDLAQALAEGIGTHIADVRRRLPLVGRLIVQIDEPMLASVLAGAVPTASGYGRHRSVDSPEASQSLEWVLGAITDAGAEPWVHSCASDTPLGLLRGAGAQGLAVDVAKLGASDTDQLAEALEAGESVALGILPTAEPTPWPTDKQIVERVERWIDMVGLAPEDVGDRLVVAPSCGLAGASPAWARSAHTLSVAAARRLR